MPKTKKEILTAICYLLQLGWTQTEIGKKLNITKKSVEDRIRYARRKGNIINTRSPGYARELRSRPPIDKDISL